MAIKNRIEIAARTKPANMLSLFDRAYVMIGGKRTYVYVTSVEHHGDGSKSYKGTAYQNGVPSTVSWKATAKDDPVEMA